MASSASHGRRRNKPVLSCSFCRGRKIGCDRKSPCGACVRRGRPEECIYTSSEQERENAIDYRPYRRKSHARARIARLENLVTELRDRTENSPHRSQNAPSLSETLDRTRSLPNSSDEETVNGIGNLSITDESSIYTGSTHWGAILEDIRCLKDEFPYDDFNVSTSRVASPIDASSIHVSSSTKVSLLTGAKYFSSDQIRTMVPVRKVVDRHISYFFNNFDSASVILHRARFLEEYARFWENIQAAPVMWVGLLFSIMSISVFLQQQSSEALGLPMDDLEDTLETYRTLTISSLAAGNYLQPSRYTIETLILHFTLEQNVNVDTYIGNWVLLGVIIRIAFRMGLHRDPSHWSNIPPFQAELRRRIWIALYQMDFFTSAQVGLPRIIKDSQCDTCPPTHLVDYDLSIAHDNTLSERPITDSNPLSNIIQRTNIIKVAAEIYDKTEAGPQRADIIAALNAKLQQAVNSIPPECRYKSPAVSIGDPPATILHRLFLDILINKAVYLLYRRSFIRSPDQEESAKSNDICIKAALAIIEHQRSINEETEPGGLFFSIRWKVVSSLNHEFLQATMMLCFALSRLGRESPPATQQMRQKIIDSLILAKGLWERSADRSIEARKAAKVISTILNKNASEQILQTPVASEWPFESISGTTVESYSSDFGYGQYESLDTFLSIDESNFRDALNDSMAENAEQGWYEMNG